MLRHESYVSMNRINAAIIAQKGIFCLAIITVFNSIASQSSEQQHRCASVAPSDPCATPQLLLPLA